MRFNQYFLVLLASGLFFISLLNYSKAMDPLREGFYLALVFVSLAWMGKQISQH